MKEGRQEVYRSDKPQDAPFDEGGKKYYNLFGRNCVGPLVDAFCSKENFCDAKTFGNSRCFYDGKWQACKTPGVQLAGSTSGTVCPGCQTPGSDTLSGVANEPPPQASAPVTGSQQIGSAYTQPTSPTAPVSPGQTSGSVPNVPLQSGNSTGQAPMPTIRQPATYAEVSTAQPVTGPALNQGTFVGIRPTSPAPSQTFPTGGIAAPAPAPTMQQTFQSGGFGGPRPTGPVSQQPSSPTAPRPSLIRSTVNRAFGAESFFNSFVSSMTSVVTRVVQPAPVQNTVVQIVQQVPRPVTVVLQTPLPQAQPQLVFVPSLPQSYVLAASTSARFISFPLGADERPAIGSLVRTDVLRMLAAEVGTAASIETPAELAGANLGGVERPRELPQQAQPNFGQLRDATSTAPNLAKQTFVLRPTLSVETTANFRAASTSARSISIVDSFFAVPIPELLEAIGQGSLDAIRSFLARIQPDRYVVETREPAERIVPMPAVANPPFSDGVAQNTETPLAPARPAAPAAQPGARVADSATKPVQSPQIFADVGREKAAWVSENTVPRGRAATIDSAEVYPSVVPVPEPKKMGSTSPSFLELVVTNGAKELRNLFSFLRNIILPSR